MTHRKVHSAKGREENYDEWLKSVRTSKKWKSMTKKERQDFNRREQARRKRDLQRRGTDRAGNPLPGGPGGGTQATINVQAGNQQIEEGHYSMMPSGIREALRTGRYGGVKLSRAEIEALEQQYGQQQGQEIQVSGIKWGRRRVGAQVRGRGWGRPEILPEREESDVYTQDAAVERLAELARTNPKEFVKLQKQLFARRYFPDNYYTGKNRKQIAYGVLDSATLDAFESALGEASVVGDLDEVLWRPLTPEQRAAMFADVTAERRIAAGDDIIDEVDLEDAMMDVEKIFRSFSLAISPESARQYAEKLIRGKRRAARRNRQPEPEEVPGIEFG